MTKVYVSMGFFPEEYFRSTVDYIANVQQHDGAIPWFEGAEQNFVKYLHLDIKIVINQSPERGSFSTLQSVLIHIPNMDVITNPIDVPVLNSIEFNQIYTAKNTVVIPNYKGENGHPIKLNASFCQALLKLENDQETARLDLQIKNLKPNNISIVNISDPLILKNLNNPENWNLFLSQDLIVSNFSRN